MAINREAFIDNFLDELAENIQLIDRSILLLKKDPHNEEELQILLRALHTVKGSARMLKFNTVEKIVHGLENVFKGVKDERYGIDKSLIQLVFITTDYLKECVKVIKETKQDQIPIDDLLNVYEKAYANETYSLDKVKLKQEAVSAGPPASSSDRPAGPAEIAEPVKPADPGKPAGPADQYKPADTGSVSAAADTGPADTGPADTGSVSAAADTGPADTGPADTGPAEAESTKRSKTPVTEGPESKQEKGEQQKSRTPDQGFEKGAADRNTTRSETVETVRIKTEKIDKIIRFMNNLIIKQFQFKKENEVLQELEESFRTLMHTDISTSPGTNIKSAEYLFTENACLKLIQSIRKRFSEELILLERNSFEVQEELLSLRMLPMDIILGTIGRMVEETAMALDKEIELKISGNDVMLDKIILEKLSDPIIHIIRNSIDHGIEMPADRITKGKPETGNVKIECYAESGTIIIKISDDGKGIDYEKIRKKALEMNPSQEEEIREMDDSGLNAFLFSSGFSTNTQVTDLSGRGVGLDIVRYNMDKIKGKISLKSEKEKGTTFTLTLPLSLATVDGFFINSGGEKFLVPANFVKEVLIVKEDEQLDLVNRKAIKTRDQIIPVYRLADLIGKKSMGKEKKLFVLVVEYLGGSIGVIVDAIIQYSSLIFKPLPKNLGKLKVLQGIVFDESFNMVNILYVPELVTKFKSIRSIDSKKKFSTDHREYKHILVVDDSFSTREIEKSVLELENYNVVTAVDGIDGLEKIKLQKFHLIVTDIHMPRMDGYTFVENLRNDDKYKNVPVVIVSSEKDKDMLNKFKHIGVGSFIDKADFDRGNLVQEVKSLIG